MADRTITVTLTMDAKQYESELRRAAKVSQGLGDANEKTATQSRSAMQRMAQSARENRAEWQQVGGSLTAVGGAVTGLMGIVAATGISYNNLRQTATQGLTAVTGSTEEAAAQMQRLDEYGQNSWLMRDSLIRAQQQMTGFGIETGKVIPYMDALAEGVAATGGSSQDFEELARVMGKVNSSGKITAETFNEFGNRGIDAAQMIGDAMGRTAGQIRDDVTSGALDAGTALDALAQGLVMNFEGSSDLVRGTFRGAVDDVMAAFRDLSSIAMTPLVDPEGGGLLVGLLNQLSDLMFSLRELPPWLLQAGAGITTLGGLATLGAGGFMLLAPRMLEAWDAARKLWPELSKVEGGLRRMTRRGLYVGGIAAAAAAAAGLASALASVADGGGVAAQSVEELTESLRGLQAGSDEAAVAMYEAFNFEGQRGFFESLFQQVAGSFGIATESVRSFKDAVDLAFDDSTWSQVRRAWDSFMNYVPGVTSDLEHAREQFESWDDAIVAAVERGDMEEASRLYDLMGQELERVGLSADMASQILPSATAAMSDAGDAAEDAEPKFTDVGIAFEDLVESFQTGAASFDDPFAGAEQGLDSWIKSLAAARREQEKWAEQMMKAAQTVRRDLPPEMQEMGREMLAGLQGMGVEGLPILNEWLAATPGQRADIVADVYGIRTDIESMDRRVAFEMYVDTELSLDSASQGMQALRDYVFGAPKPTTLIDADPELAESILENLLSLVDESDGTIDILGFSLPAEQVLNALLDDVNTSEGTTNLNAKDTDAQSRLRSLINDINRSRGYTNVDADLTDAKNKTARFQPPSKSMKITADMASVRAAINNYKPTVTARVAGIFGGLASGGYAGDLPQFASGGSPAHARGLLEGPGTTTSDSILARLSRKEFVVNAAATSKLGVDAAYRVNSGRFDAGAVRAALGLADGGYAGQRYRTEYLPTPRASSASQAQLADRGLSDRDVERIAAAVRDGAESGTAAGFGASAGVLRREQRTAGGRV